MNITLKQAETILATAKQKAVKIVVPINIARGKQRC